jgi:hypothetical protein
VNFTPLPIAPFDESLLEARELLSSGRRKARRGISVIFHSYSDIL